MLWNTFVVVVTVALMEVFSIVAHKYVMHGFGWGWHRSHHEARSGAGRREATAATPPFASSHSFVARVVPARSSQACTPRRLTSIPIWRYTLRAVAMAHAERSGSAAMPPAAES